MRFFTECDLLDIIDNMHGTLLVDIGIIILRVIQIYEAQLTGQISQTYSCPTDTSQSSQGK